MSSKHTENYELCQWEPEDKVVHGDFNEDNRKIDKAIKAVDVRVDGKADASALAKEVSERTAAVSSLQSALNTLQTKVENKQDASGAVRLAAGRYAGTTTSSSSGGSGSQTISLPFQPKAVLVIREDGNITNAAGNAFIFGGLAVADCPGIFNGHTTLEITGSGFRVHTYWTSGDNRFIQLNDKGHNYHYIALG